MADPKLIDKLHGRLPRAGGKLLASVLAFARDERLSLYLVGGPVRDLILDRESLDLDIVVEGDAIAISRRLAQSTGVGLRTHPAFGTASLRLDGFVLDLITARDETYARPGALPTVTPASIREDLLRRDFTINAMALSLTGANHEILDPAGGQADLENGLIRVLHERSFQDDATRILRACRYACRFGFAIEPQTLAWLKRDVGNLNLISGTRLRQELSGILSEPEPERTLQCLFELEALWTVNPGLHFAMPDVPAAFLELRRISAPLPAAYWPVFGWDAADLAPLLTRLLALTNAQRTALESMPALRALEPSVGRRNLKRSAVVETLLPFPLPALWACAALTDVARAKERLLDYLTTARHVRPFLRGDDLIALGVPAGPDIGETLRVLRDAKLDDEVHTRADEERLVHKLISSSAK